MLASSHETRTYWHQPMTLRHAGLGLIFWGSWRASKLGRIELVGRYRDREMLHSSSCRTGRTALNRSAFEGWVCCSCAHLTCRQGCQLREL